MWFSSEKKKKKKKTLPVPPWHGREPGKESHVFEPSQAVALMDLVGVHAVY